MLRSLVACLILLAPGALGQTRLSPEAFEALAEGRTLHFNRDGAPFGAEQFFAGRRSLWRFDDALCEEGSWYGEGEAICFVYAGMPDPSCWHFSATGDSYAAEALEDGVATGFVLDLDRIDAAPLPCPGPEVGS